MGVATTYRHPGTFPVWRNGPACHTRFGWVKAQMNPEGSQPAGGSSSEPEAFVWRAEGQPVEIVLAFDVIDRMSPEIGDAFRALRRRGAEVGGILLGSVIPGERTTVQIANYVAVPCERRFGPSYTLSDADLALFDRECAKWRSAAGNLRLVGFYRSNTREHIALSDADMQLLASRFPEPYMVVLLVKPYADKAFDAAFYVRKGGGLTAAGQSAFPFRRSDLGGGVSPLFTPQPGIVEALEKASARSRMLGGNLEAVQETPAVVPPPPTRRLPAEASLQSAAPLPPETAPAPAGPPPQSQPQAAEAPAAAEAHPYAAPVPVRSGVAPWAAALLSILFAAGGLVGGYLIAGSRNEAAGAVSAAALNRLGLQAQIDDGVITLSWDSAAPAFRDALRGLVTIEDGDNTRIIDLEASDLARNRMRFRPQTSRVDIRMDVFTTERAGATETITFPAR